MCPAPMVVVNEALKVSIQAALAKYDHVIQALAANGPDHTFDIGVLPWRPRRRKHLFDAHGLHLVDEVLAEDPIPIPEQISRYSVPRKGLAHLLSSPLHRWMRRRSCASTRNTYSIWNRIVGTAKKSTDT